MSRLAPIIIRPTYMSPAGAAIYVDRNTRIHLTSIRIDRLPIDDATPEQCAAIRSLAISEWIEHVVPTLPEPRETSFCADPTFWQFYIHSSREAEVLQKIHQIEGGGA